MGENNITPFGRNVVYTGDVIHHHSIELDKLINKKVIDIQIIALTNQKGGVGKITCAINIGAGLNKLGKRVLLINLGSQAHFLTYSLCIPAYELKNTVYELLRGTVTLKETIIERNGLSLVPSFLNFSGAEIEFSGLAGREFYLARFFYKAKKGIIMNKKTL